MSLFALYRRKEQLAASRAKRVKKESGDAGNDDEQQGHEKKEQGDERQPGDAGSGGDEGQVSGSLVSVCVSLSVNMYPF